MTGSVKVWLRGGVYELDRGLVLDARTSGTASGQTSWSGYPGERAVIVGGRRLSATQFSPISPASPLYGRLDVSARAAVQVASLAPLGIDGGALLERGAFCANPGRSALELLVGGQPQTLARWPDVDEDTQQHPSINAASLEVYGTGLVPDVRGTYTRIGTSDGASVFRRVGLVNGLQYHLYRMSWLPNGVPFTAWYLTTNTSGYPSSNPFWYLHTHELDDMAPAAAGGAQGWVSFKNPAGIDHGLAMVAREISSTTFGYESTRPNRWTQASDVWLHGMLRFEWTDCHQRIASIDTTNRTLTLTRAPNFGIGVGHHWSAENLVEEITRPGEWWLDRSTGALLVWPPASFASQPITLTTVEEPLVRISATNVTFENVEFEGGRSTQVLVQADSVRLRNLALHGAGTHAVVLDGRNLSLEHSLVTSSGNSGVRVSGGDRTTLTSGNNRVTDCTIKNVGRWEWTYQPAILLEGVGHRAMHNRIEGHPHTAILFSGNDHLIASNDISRVCRMARDSGAIYSGRDWSFRGNQVRANAIHDLESLLGWDVHGVYLDDCLPGTEVSQNVFHGITGYGIHHGGGMDDVMTSNVFSRTRFALGTDRRCTVTVNHTPGDTWNLLEKLNAFAYQQPPWSTRYPALAALPNDWALISAPGSTWLEPRGSRFSSNVGDGFGDWERLADRFVLPAFAEVTNNRPDAGSLFVDAGFVLSPNATTTGFLGFPAAELGVRPHD